MAAKFQVLQSHTTVFIREKGVERKAIKKHSPLFLSLLLGRRPFLVISKTCCCCLVAILYLFLTLWTVAHQAPLSMRFPKNTGVDCHFLLQSIFLNQGLNLHLLHQQMDSLPLSHLGRSLPNRSPKSLETVGKEELESQDWLIVRLMHL